jgi:hypothetical protein
MTIDCVKPQQEIDYGDQPPRPPLGETQLIDRPGILVRHTIDRSTDATTAIKRGLKEYLEQLAIDTESGRRIEFERVFDVWADGEHLAEYPSAVVYVTGDSIYDAHNMSPTVRPEMQIFDGATETRTYLVKAAELQVDLLVEVWCTDPEERVAVKAMLEDALNPVDWMYGFVLELPHYHNTRAKYEMLTSKLPDTEANAFRRDRQLSITIRSTIPVLRVAQLPSAKPRLEITVEG